MTGVVLAVAVLFLAIRLLVLEEKVSRQAGRLRELECRTTTTVLPAAFSMSATHPDQWPPEIRKLWEKA